MILEHVWGMSFDPESNVVDVYVQYLRRKTEAGGQPRLIHTERGVGYVLRPDDPDACAILPGARLVPGPGMPLLTPLSLHSHPRRLRSEQEVPS